MTYHLPLRAKTLADELWYHWSEIQRLCRVAKNELTDARRSLDQSHNGFLEQYHLLEVLGSFNGYQGYRIAKSLQDTLITRRQAKWDVATLEELVEWIDRTDIMRTLDRGQHGLLTVQRKVDRQNTSAERYIEGRVEESA